MSDDVPPPAFWSGVSEIADAIEEEIAAVNASLSVDVKAADAKTVYVEK